MPRQVNRHGGGARTNANGLHFEQTTDLNTALENVGYRVDNGHIYNQNVEIGLSAPKHNIYKNFLEPNKINYKEINSKRWLPDEAFINYQNNTVYIIEKKFQNVSGSVDEKLPGCDFKKKEYEKLFNPLNYQVEFIYVFNDWFKQPEYKDILEYIKNVGCRYFYNEIPLNILGL